MEAIANDLFDQIEATRPTTIAGAIAALEWRIAMFGGGPLGLSDYSLDVVIGGLCAIARYYGMAEPGEDLQLDADADLFEETARPTTIAGAIAALEWRIAMFGSVQLTADQYSLDVMIAGLRQIAKRYREPLQ